MDLPPNKTLATEVILLGFSNNFKINLALFFFFLVVYLVTVFGNGFMMCAIIACSHLHTPMYYFLCNLAFIDFFLSSTTVPKLLKDLLVGGRTSLITCDTQVFVLLFLGSTENMLLAAMAYDRYVAICKPLYYPVLMRWSICHRLTVIVWIYSFMLTVVPNLLLPMRACNPNQINHITCEILAFMKLSCDGANKNKVMVFFLSFCLLPFPFIIILLSYFFIISSILKLQSAGRSKAFSTCSSHLTVVVLLYGPEMFMYFGPGSQYIADLIKYLSVFYGIMVPMLNPLIYSLKNKEVTKIFSVK